jgi:DNA-binding NarL/FixJ family response regulator
MNSTLLPMASISATTVCIVEDNRGTRDSLVALLNGVTGLRCVGAYANGEDALSGIPAEKPDVALVDINLPGISGIECVSRLKLKLPALQVLMLTTYVETDLIFNSLRAGASGYMLKNRPPAELVQAIEQVCAGGAPMSLQIARKVVEHFQKMPAPTNETQKLSQREYEVLALLSKGCLYKEIADQLSISLHTVRTYMKRIYEKLHVQSRTEAAAKFAGRD